MAWDTCSETCGLSGTKTRYRACDNPSPRIVDMTCSGDAFETQSCNQIPCGNDMSSYQDARQHTSAVLAGRKNESILPLVSELLQLQI